MGYHNFNIAPQDALIQYLAVFSRFFREAQRLCAARDYYGIVMIGYAANALHNIPDHMRYFPNWSDIAYPRDGSWSARFRGQGTSDSVVAIWDGIFNPANDKHELGLEDDLSNWELPLPAVFSGFMELFSRAYVDIRVLSSLRDHSVQPVNYYKINASRVAGAEDTIVLAEIIARALAPLLPMIAHWSSFDAAVFAQSRRIVSSLKGSWWIDHFETLTTSIQRQSMSE